MQRLRIQAALQYAGFHLRQQDGSLRSIGERYAADVELEPKDDGWVVRMRVLIKAPELHQEAVVGVLDPLADELNDLQIITRGDGHIEFRRQQYEPGIVDTRAVTVAFTETLSQAAWVHKQITGDWE